MAEPDAVEAPDAPDATEVIEAVEAPAATTRAGLNGSTPTRGFSFVVDARAERRRRILGFAAIAVVFCLLIAVAMWISVLLGGASVGSIATSVRLAGSGVGSLSAGGAATIGVFPLDGASGAGGALGSGGSGGAGGAGAKYPPPASTQAATTPLPPSPPARIWIPSISVTSALVRLGLQPNGTLEVPSQFGVAGWWAGGPSPGEKGPAVIVGHVDSTAGPGVFYRLGRLRPGAVVWVSREDGASVEFVVQRVEQVSKTRFPTGEVYGPQPGAALRLVTCGGAFDGSTGHYVDNVIVFASAAH